MGIHGLLPLVRDAIKNTHISTFTGKKVAVDGFVWLHRGCLTCAKELANNQQTTKYITYFMQQVQLLLNHGIRPLIDFDGCDLPAKRVTNEKRRNDRIEQIQIAKKLEERGLITEASEHYQKTVEITPNVLYPLFERLRHNHIEFIVAPYEADAQLAFLAYNKIVDLVITEDSDLIVYQSPLTIFKLDREGNCQSLSRSDFLKLPTFSQMDQKMIIECCVLSGCDYLPSIPRMGIRTAIKRLLTYRSSEAVISGLRAEAKWEIPNNYEQSFKDACAIFTQQRVFDPRTNCAVGIYDECVLDIAGPFISNYEAVNIAYGRMNPKTKELFDPDKSYETDESVVKFSCSYRAPIQVTDSARSKFKPHNSSSDSLDNSSPDTTITTSSKKSVSFDRELGAEKYLLINKPQNIPPALRRRFACHSSPLRFLS